MVNDIKLSCLDYIRNLNWYLVEMKAIDDLRLKDKISLEAITESMKKSYPGDYKLVLIINNSGQNILIPQFETKELEIEWKLKWS